MTEKKSIKRAIIHIFSSYNNTILTTTDLSGAETICSYSGGMVVRSGREKPGPYAAMQVANKTADDLKSKGIEEVDVLMRATGGTDTHSYGPGAQAALRSLTRAGIRINRMEDVTPTPTGIMRRPGGKRGRRV